MGKKGNGVIITYHSKKDEADEVVKEIEQLGQKAVTLQSNATDSKSFTGFVSQVKSPLKQKWDIDHFDSLVNNKEIDVQVSFAETTEEQFGQMVNINLKVVFFLKQKLLPLIADGSRIVNISTGLTRFALPSYAAFTTMKGAIETLTKELGARGITVNVVAPGAIKTYFGGGAVRDNEELINFFTSQIALGRVGLPDDIGGAIASLLSEDNRWVNA